MEPVLGSSGHWPDSTTFWRDKRVVVTGGAGFLGSFIVEKLHARNAADVFVPRIEDYDLRDLAAIRRMLAESWSASWRLGALA